MSTLRTKAKIGKAPKEVADQLEKYAANEKQIKILKNRIKALGAEQDQIFKSVRPAFNKKPMMSVKNFVFKISISGAASVSYKTLYSEAMEHLNTLNKKIYDKMIKRQGELTKPPSTEKIQITEL